MPKSITVDQRHKSVLARRMALRLQPKPSSIPASQLTTLSLLTNSSATPHSLNREASASPPINFAITPPVFKENVAKDIKH